MDSSYFKKSWSWCWTLWVKDLHDVGQRAIKMIECESQLAGTWDGYWKEWLPRDEHKKWAEQRHGEWFCWIDRSHRVRPTTIHSRSPSSLPHSVFFITKARFYYSRKYYHLVVSLNTAILPPTALLAELTADCHDTSCISFHDFS